MGEDLGPQDALDKAMKLLVMMKDFILLVLVSILVVIFLFLLFLKNKPSTLPISGQTPVPSQKYDINSWQDLDPVEPPQAFDIGEIRYYRGDKGCCFCSAVAYVYKKSGGTNYQQLFEDILRPSYQRDMTSLFQQLKKYGLGNRLFFGYYHQGQSREARPRFTQTYTDLLQYPDRQLKLFTNRNEAVSYLKKAVSAGIPVIVAIEDDTASGKSPTQEVEDDTFVTVIGYNKNQVKLYWIPDTKSWMDWDEFMAKWQLQNTQFVYELIPGNYPMIFLSL